MEKFVINGGKTLNGIVNVSTSKNAILPILAGSILTDENVYIKNFPMISDSLNMVKILEGIGVICKFYEGGLIVNPSFIRLKDLPKNLCEKMRSSVLLMGALLSKFGCVNLYYPGGCKIGDRPIDLHIESLRKLGYKIECENSYISCKANNLKATTINLKYPSVGATENIILASIFINGKTTIKNCALEPEIIDLCDFLNSMGANIKGMGTNTILIQGIKKLGKTSYSPIKDRVEAGTFIILNAICGGNLEIRGVDVKKISPLIKKIQNNTCKIHTYNDIIYISKLYKGKGTLISTGPYPLFPTDLQAQMVSLCSVMEGASTVYENVFENRFSYTEQLKKLGAKIIVKNNVAFINGVNNLKGNKVIAEDLRGGASLILAGLQAQGTTEVVNTSFVDRGYENFVQKLKNIGADIKREKCNER